MYKSMEFWWNNIDRLKLKNLERSCTSATLSTTNPTISSRGLNPGLEVEGQKTNCPSNGTVLKCLDNTHNMLFYFTHNKRYKTQAQGAAKCVKLCYLTTDSTAKDTQFTMK